MKLRTSVLLLVTLLIGATMCFAADPNLGTWKLNEGKSKTRPGSRRTLPLLMTPLAMASKPRWKALTVKGKPTHNEWTASTMAKYYPGHRRLEFRYAVAQEDQRPSLELTAKQGRQGYDYRPDRCRGRRQEPHADGNWTDADGQESEERLPFYDKQ